MALLKLNLLGVFETQLDDAPLTRFRSQKERALLAYLALEGTRPLSRESLATLLWPDYATQKSLTNLRNSLSRLRKVWRSATAETDTPPFLLVTRQSIQLNPDSYIETDVAQFEALCKQIKQHNHQDNQLCIECGQAAVELAQLYQGDFLQGFSLPDSPDFDDWRLSKQEQYHQMAMGVLDQLTAGYLAQNAFAEVQTFVHQQLQLEPWHETAHQRLMRALASTGQREAALKQYEICQRVLADELGVEPGPETVSLVDQLREGQALTVPERSTFRHNLPAAATGFVGRESELEQILTILAQPDCRLLTLVGPGGTGKTRLALQVAWHLVREDALQFTDGIFFISLVEATDLDIAVNTIATALGLEFHGAEPTVKQLTRALGPKKSLLVLDNLEQLSVVWEFIGDLLRQAPQVSILATSRLRLKLHGEWLIPIEGLPVPDQINESIGFESTALSLFAQRAQQSQADFILTQLPAQELRAVHQICQLVDGMPLALELAGQWVQVLPCTDIAQEIKNSLTFLESTFQDLPQRQRSISAVIDYSWRQLSEQEQKALCNLTVFVGGFDRQAAYQVAGVSLLTLMSILEKSLLKRSEFQRFELHPLVKQFVVTKVQDQLPKDQHSKYYLNYLSEKGASINHEGHKKALDELLTNIDNIRKAWETAVEANYLSEILKATYSISNFYNATCRFQEGSLLFDKAIDQVERLVNNDYRSSEINGKQLLIKLMLGRETLHHHLSKRDAQSQDLHILQNLVSEFPEPELQAQVTFRQARIKYATGDLAEAHRLAQTTVNLANDKTLEAEAELQTGLVIRRLNNNPAAKRKLNRALEIAQEIGRLDIQADSFRNLAGIFRDETNYTLAQAYLHNSIQIATELNNRQLTGSNLIHMGVMSWIQLDFPKAIQYYQESLHILQSIGDIERECIVLNNLGVLAESYGEYSQAKAHFEEAVKLVNFSENRNLESGILGNLGSVAFCQESFLDAQSYYQDSLSISRDINVPMQMAYALAGLGNALVGQGKFEEALPILEEAVQLRGDLNHTPLQVETRISFAEAMSGCGKHAQALTIIEEPLKYLNETEQLEGTQYLLRNHLVCIKILELNRDSRSTHILKQAVGYLRSQAEKFTDSEMRNSFLYNIPWHLEIMQRWEGLT